MSKWLSTIVNVVAIASVPVLPWREVIALSLVALHFSVDWINLVRAVGFLIRFKRARARIVVFLLFLLIVSRFYCMNIVYMLVWIVDTSLCDCPWFLLVASPGQAQPSSTAPTPVMEAAFPTRRHILNLCIPVWSSLPRLLD